MVVSAVFPTLVVIAAVGVLAVVVMRASRRGPVAEPSCAACGYAVRGLEKLICPECGSDLRLVGITTPHARTRMSPVGRALLWTMLLPIPALSLSAVISDALPAHSTREQRIDMGKPQSGAYGSVVIFGYGSGPSGSVPVATVTMRFSTATGLSPTLLINGLDLTFELDDGRQRTPGLGEFSQDAVIAWMSTAGVDTGDPAVAQEAEDLYERTLAVALGGSAGPSPHFPGTTSSSFRRRSPPPWFAPTAILFWLLIWVGGIVVTLRRRS
jgi:hypothetical protein